MKKRWLSILLVIVLLGAAGVWLADRQLKKHAHPGLITFVKQWWHNYPKSFAMHPPVIAIEVKEKGMEQLEAVVERARDKGVIEQEGNDYVKASFTVEDRTFKGKLRIKGKMTDHVEGKKWSFRVVLKKGEGEFLGMKRFSLQHPGTRNYLCDWFYHRLMRGEGIIALRYGFCKVMLNGDDLGVYAYEEHFAPQLLQNNDRVHGPIVRFDPSLFWQHRLNGMESGPRVDDAFGTYQAAALDAFDTDDIAKDSARSAEFEEAIAVMDAFRRGERPASEVFDVDRIGRQMAIIDLIGGHHSMDWSDVKYYFDPKRKVFEPISYESFSASATKELAGAYRCTGPFSEGDELHTALFKDPVIFASYMRHLQRVSAKHYLDSAFTALKGPLDTASATLYGEFPYKELDRSIYYKNQQAIAKLLELPKACHAYTQEVKGDTIVLALVPINALPLVVDSLTLAEGSIARPVKPSMVCSRGRGKTGRPITLKFVATSATEGKKGMVLHCHLPGTTRSVSAEVSPFAYTAVESARPTGQVQHP